MIDLLLVGIGTGNPEHLTLRAVRAIRSADRILIPRKGEEKAALAELRRTICAEVVDAPARIVEFDLPLRDADRAEYRDAVDDWHDAIAAVWADTLGRALPDGGRAALLVWGDPGLYDSSLRIAERVALNGLPLAVEVVPGITSIQALTAAHRLPLNTVGGPFVVTTGRRLRAEGWPPGAETVVVMLDGGTAFEALPPDGFHIWWGAYLGMPQEILLAGPLGATAPRIVAARSSARAEHGWIMDTYILRRSAAG